MATPVLNEAGSGIVLVPFSELYHVKFPVALTKLAHVVWAPGTIAHSSCDLTEGADGSALIKTFAGTRWLSQPPTIWLTQ